MKSLYEKLKPKEGEASRTGEVNARKGWLDNFRKRFGFKNVKITGEETSADQEAADEFQDIIKKITEEKEYLPKQVFNVDNSVLIWKKKKNAIKDIHH